MRPLLFALVLAQYTCVAAAIAKEEAGAEDTSRTMLPLSGKSFHSLLADGFEVRSSVTGLLVLQKPGKPLPAYFCEIGGVEGRGMQMTKGKDGKSQEARRTPQLVVSGCFELTP